MTTDVSTKPPPPPWFFNLGLHDSAKAAGRWLRDIREALSGTSGSFVSQVQMADYLGVERKTVLRYENGETTMPYEVVIKLLVQEMRLVGLGKVHIEDSLVGQLFTSKAIPIGIKDSTYKALIEGLTLMREASWTKSPSSV